MEEKIALLSYSNCKTNLMLSDELQESTDTIVYKSFDNWAGYGYGKGYPKNIPIGNRDKELPCGWAYYREVWLYPYIDIQRTGSGIYSSESGDGFGFFE